MEIATPFYGQYWFVTAFVCFLLLLPLLQLLLLKMDAKALKFACIVLLVTCPLRAIITSDLFGDLGDFITVFFIVGYLKKHQGNWIEKHSRLGLVFYAIFVIFIILVGEVLPTTFFGHNLNGGKGSIYITIIRHIRFMTIIQLFGALFVFYALKQIKMKPSRTINTLAKSAFGVYLLHYNIMFRGLIWQDLFSADQIYKETNLYCLLLLFGPIIVYCLLPIIETIRSFLFDKYLYEILPWNRKISVLLDRNYEWVQSTGRKGN